jgi:hypothetical protein
VTGWKPIHLAERFATAEVRKREAETEIGVVKAREEFEKTMAEVNRIGLDGQASADKVKAEAEILRAKARREEAKARIMELAAKQIERRLQTPRETVERVQAIISQIEAIHGGRIELQLPEPSEDSPAQPNGGQ